MPQAVPSTTATQPVLFESGSNPACDGAAPPHMHTGHSARRAKRSAMRLCVLGSGSGGNSTLLRLDDKAMLIDAGFGPITTRRRLAQTGTELEQVRAICLTHLDQDHFRPVWPRTLLKHGIRLHLQHWHLPQMATLPGADALFDAGLVDIFDGDPFEPLDGVTARAVRLQHDLQGTIGYRFDAQSRESCGTQRAAGSVAYATDLGHVPMPLIELFAGVDVLCLESNYDHRMTVTSPRPTFVNRRNLSDSGHLSNEQALDAVRRIAAASPHGNPRHVVLMHRSQVCNHPTKVRRTFEQEPWLVRRITLTQQRRRTGWLDVKPLSATRRCQQVLPFRDHVPMAVVETETTTCDR